jgi:hypothetical protein
MNLIGIAGTQFLSTSQGVQRGELTEDQVIKTKELIQLGVEQPVIDYFTACQLKGEYYDRLEEAKNFKALGLELKGNSYYWGSHISVPLAIIQELRKEDADVEAIKNFWIWSQLNPNPASREMLFEHCITYGIQITKEGMLVMYRNVLNKDINQDLLEYYNQFKEIPVDILKTIYFVHEEKEYSAFDLVYQPHLISLGTFTDAYTKTFKIEIGKEVAIPRASCDESQATCSRGLHLAAKTWLSAGYFGTTGIACLVNPMNIVSAPMADNYGKIRTCAYLPIGIVDYEGNEIVDNIDALAFSYASITQSLLEDVVHSVEGKTHAHYSLPELVAKFKEYTNLEDLEVPEVEYVSASGVSYAELWADDCEEDYDWDEEDNSGLY